ncbi:MAG TPA: metallophosphoesterase, partial [Vicinamibacterales bacterium]|nr:metallophosphoesterase [Vicinamibacterales bacterium]
SLGRWSVALLGFAIVSTASAIDLVLPNRSGSVKFVVLGDFGSGEPSEYEVAAQMAAFRARFPFDFVITTGDNIIGSQDEPEDFAEKFERPFQTLLAAKVPFYATLGNHDKASNRSYAPWNMNGRRYYTFAVKNVRFFALDSNRPDRAELAWVDEALRSSSEEWKICYFHHPLYSNGVKHGPALELRVLLEPILVRNGVDIVFSGHDHVYERLTPQAGISYFVTGAGGQAVRTLRRSATTAASFDREQTFTAIEVLGDDLFFQTVSRSGATVDAGGIRKRGETSPGEGR